jgi:hypothetical protein
MSDQSQPTQTATPSQEPDITLTLNLSEIKVIVSALDEIPRKFSNPIVENIVIQTNKQLQALQAE